MAVLQLKTGEIQYYWDMKAPFTGWIHFPDDYTIVGGNSGLPHLDLRTGKISQNQYEWKNNEQITPDGRLAVWIDYEQDRQGVLTQYLRTQHNNEEPRQIAAAKGGRMQIIAVTNQSVICWYGTNEPDIDGTRRKGYCLFRLPQ